MFDKAKTANETVPPPPPGVSEVVFCVFDEKGRLFHHFISSENEQPAEEWFRLLNDPNHILESDVLREAVSTHKSASISFSYGEGHRKFLYVLPFEQKPDRWRFACLQVAAKCSDPDTGISPTVCMFADDRVCLLLTDALGVILSVGAQVPDVFGYSAEILKEMNFSDLFTLADLDKIASTSPSASVSTLSCVFHCLDGSRRDVEVKKYAAPDGCMLYGICDTTRPQSCEEIAIASTRDRRRIGQDLHDSVGQVLTGISLLSRSLAISLHRDNHPDNADAEQISELADYANNQIRQISRGLMLSEIVHRGLFASLRDLAKVTTDSCGLVCGTQIDEQVEFADGAVETHLFRIAQEAVNNAVRHAEASQIDIIVSPHNGMPQLVIADNGRWRNILENSGGIGLKTMQYRASAINAHLTIEKAGDKGTRVVCRLKTDEFLETKV